MNHLVNCIPLTLYGVLSVGLALLLARRTQKYTTRGLVFLIVSTTAFALLEVMKSQAPLNAYVSIQSPQNGETFRTPAVNVVGTVSPPDATVSVLVHPEDTDQWWVQSSPIVHSTSGHWQAVCYIGTDSMGIGRNFDIVAVGSASPWFLDALLGRTFAPGRTMQRLPLISKSQLVVIKREE